MSEFGAAPGDTRWISGVFPSWPALAVAWARCGWAIPGYDTHSLESPLEEMIFLFFFSPFYICFWIVAHVHIWAPVVNDSR